MQFHFVDQILEVAPGRKICVAKNLTLGEEYLADHFPTFPVMPGVLMLQTLVEAASWLLRISEDFRFSTIALREVRNVKYGQFVEPGRKLIVTAELVEDDGTVANFKGKGEVEGTQTLSARVSLNRYNLAARDPGLAYLDDRIVGYFRSLYPVLRATPMMTGASNGV
jgi:3-hydroxyacyl-[acyl-carrier-protein] dehydratase